MNDHTNYKQKREPDIRNTLVPDTGKKIGDYSVQTVSYSGVIQLLNSLIFLFPYLYLGPGAGVVESKGDSSDVGHPYPRRHSKSGYVSSSPDF